MPGMSRIIEIEVISGMGKSYQVTTTFPSKSEIMQRIYNEYTIDRRYDDLLRWIRLICLIPLN